MIITGKNLSVWSLILKRTFIVCKCLLIAELNSALFSNRSEIELKTKILV